MTAAMSQETRALRSKERPKTKDEEKFNFDEEEYEIDPTQRLKTVNRGYPKVASGLDILLNADEKRKLIDSMVLEVKHHDIAPNNSSEDALPDDLYFAYHKKMSRHEIRMLDSDLVQGENEADKLLLLSEKLDLAQWQTTLKRITVIQNPDDKDEMERKRLLTKETIDSMLVKYQTMKKNRTIALKNHRSGKIDPVKCWPQIYRNIDRRVVLGYHSSSDEEENKMDADRIRAHRRKRRENQCRGSIIIQLTMAPQSHQTKYAIVAEPLRKPYVIKISNEERQAWIKQMQGSPEKFIHYRELPSQIAVPKRKVAIPLTLDKEHTNAKNFDKTADLPAKAPFSKSNIFVPSKKVVTDEMQIEPRTLTVKRIKKK